MKIGSVPYLNARPLVEWFERCPRPDVELSYAPPSELVEKLLAGELDIAMASTFAILRYHNLCLMPGLGVTVSGPALSVRLFSNVPLRDIRTLALDCSSRSSVILASIILADRYGVTPKLQSALPNLAEMLSTADAAVLIGDMGLTESGMGLTELDLGQEWWELTGLPFYFAGWISRDQEMLERAKPLFFNACDYGLQHLPEIAESEALRLRVPRELCYHYLADVMRYEAGEAEMEGLREFGRRAERLGLLGE